MEQNLPLTCKIKYYFKLYKIFNIPLNTIVDIYREMADVHYIYLFQEVLLLSLFLLSIKIGEGEGIGSGSDSAAGSEMRDGHTDALH